METKSSDNKLVTRSEVYSEPSKISKMERFPKIVFNKNRLLTVNYFLLNTPS